MISRDFGVSDSLFQRKQHCFIPFRPSTNHGIENSEIEAYLIDANLCQLLILSKTDRSTDIKIFTPRQDTEQTDVSRKEI